MVHFNVWDAHFWYRLAAVRAAHALGLLASAPAALLQLGTLLRGRGASARASAVAAGG